MHVRTWEGERDNGEEEEEALKRGWYPMSSENREGGNPEMVVGSWGKENELRVTQN